MGVSTTQMESKGIETERGNINREIVRHNNILTMIMENLKRLKDWLKEALAPKSPPPLVELLHGVLECGEMPEDYGKIRNLKAAEQVLGFMRENGVSTMSELRAAVSKQENRLASTREKLILLNVLREAEKIVREINAPQRTARDRERER